MTAKEHSEDLNKRFEEAKKNFKSTKKKNKAPKSRFKYYKKLAKKELIHTPYNVIQYIVELEKKLKDGNR